MSYWLILGWLLIIEQVFIDYWLSIDWLPGDYSLIIDTLLIESWLIIDWAFADYWSIIDCLLLIRDWLPIDHLLDIIC